MPTKTLDERVARIEKIFWVVAVLAVIFGISGAWGLNALKNANLTLDDIKYIIPHQANGRITMGLAKTLKIPLEKICNIIKDIGNTSGSSVPIALDKLVRGELPGYKIKKGDNLVLTAIGIGYTMGAVVMEMREMRAAT